MITKEPLLVRFIIISHTVINHNKSDFSKLSVCIAHFVPTDSPYCNLLQLEFLLHFDFFFYN